MFHEEEDGAVESKGLYYQMYLVNQRYSNNYSMCILYSINAVPVMYSNKSDRCFIPGKISPQSKSDKVLDNVLRETWT